MRLLAMFVLFSSSTAAADQIAYGGDDDLDDLHDPDAMWLPWSLLDRMQIAPARLSVTTEIGSLDKWQTATSTLHAQVSTSCDCRFGAYFTLPLAYSLADPDQPLVAAAGSTPPLRQQHRLGFRTSDVGLFFSPKADWSNEEIVWRIGALLPTARADAPHTTSARAADMVLELPRSAGARFSASHNFGWMNLPASWFGTTTFGALRWDTGLDLAYELDTGPEERSMHVVPHAGLGALIAFRPGTVSIDTVLAMDPTDEGDMNVRWSTGVTGRLARPDPHRGSWLQPALTVAMVRTPEGWGGTIALDLAATRHRDGSSD
jgi:hypothetical protein